MLSRGMTAHEQEKFSRLERRLAELFTSSGQAARLCEGRNKGGSRLIRFLSGLSGDAILALPAGHFLSASDGDVLREIGDLLAAGEAPSP